MMNAVYNENGTTIEIEGLTEEEEKEVKIKERIEEIDFEIMVLDMHRSFDRGIAYRVINKLMNEKKELLDELK